MGLAKHIEPLTEFIDETKALQSRWEQLRLLSELTQVGADIDGTKQHFKKLANDLGNCLIEQTVRKTAQDLSAKAQSVIDILVRNLFERTADIGFLSEDTELLEACLAYENKSLEDELLEKIKQRMQDYQKKYSVYDNIVLFDKDSCVITDMKGVYSRHQKVEWIKNGVAASKNYFEKFDRIDPAADAEKSLVYSWAIRNSGKTCGYISLMFNVEEEKKSLLSRIMPTNEDQQNWSLCGICDADGRVIFSSSESALKAGETVHVDTAQNWSVTRVGATLYLCCARRTQGYQGYTGPNWTGFCLTPLSTAFDQPASEKNASTQQAVRIEWNPDNTLLDPMILNIKDQALRIQTQLNQSVWNGNIGQRQKKRAIDDSFSRSLIWEISKTGEETKKLFNTVLTGLVDTFLGRQQDKQKNMAALAIDIMDRNLYERANDCRWWALTELYEKLLGNKNNENLVQACIQKLKHTNSLYTVYSDVILFDADGIVLANSADKDLRGLQLKREWVGRCLAQKNQNHYVVSKFEASELYDNRPTYIYSAAIHKYRHNPQQALGGIALVFDSEPQFEAILNECSVGQKGVSSAYIVDTQMNVISSSSDRFIENGKLKFPLHLPATFRKEDTRACIEEFNDFAYSVGICNSGNYREYKSDSDCYQNNLMCIFIQELGKIDKCIGEEEVPAFSEFRSNPNTDETLEIATFRLDESWFGMPSDCIWGSIVVKTVASMPKSAPYLVGTVLHHEHVVPLIDAKMLLGMRSVKQSDVRDQQVLLLNTDHGGGPIGILIDQLGEIPNIPISKIQETDKLKLRSDFIKGLVDTEQTILNLLDGSDFEKLFAYA